MPAGAAALAHPALPWIARLGLTGIFLLGLVKLVHDAIQLS
ncbi:hypothetical protein ONA91_16965 [Micromonospora sp. DR5-3]|nr:MULTISPECIES: hypothetical protein [unclassified Micromonospora]MCW3816136.1 hypothetical protein [Micromonospora sp. DR5-3]